MKLFLQISVLYIFWVIQTIALCALLVAVTYGFCRVLDTAIEKTLKADRATTQELKTQTAIVGRWDEPMTAQEMNAIMSAPKSSKRAWYGVAQGGK